MISKRGKSGELFSDIVEKYEKEIYSHVRRLGLYDTTGKYFQEGVFGLWEAYKTFDSLNGDFTLLANTNIKSSITNRSWQTEYRFEQNHLLSVMLQQDTTNGPNVNISINQYDWSTIQEKLTVNQWKWLYYHVILDKLPKQIGDVDSRK